MARVSRVLKQAGGHAMLIGVGGSGKQSLAKLAIYMTELIPMTIVISKGYGLNDFKTDLQVKYPSPNRHLCAAWHVRGQQANYCNSELVLQR